MADGSIDEGGQLADSIEDMDISPDIDAQSVTSPLLPAGPSASVPVFWF